MVHLPRQVSVCERVSTTNSQQIPTKCSLYTCVYWGDKLVQTRPTASLWEPAYLGGDVHQQGCTPKREKH